MKTFRDKVAVVTGAASGIGQALAERSAREGMKVVLADIEEKVLDETAKSMKAGGATVLPVVTDVSKAANVEGLAEKTLSQFGAVHLVCNNAGVAPLTKAIWDTTLSDWQWCLGVNLWGVIHGIRTFVPIMISQDTEGHVVNVASMAGLATVPYMAIYHATKHAVVAITECLSHELALRNSKVKASVLCPGWVRTRILDPYRNRPVELGGPSEEDPKGVMSVWEACRKACEAGFPAEFVADQVFHAIWNDQFYIFTTREFHDLMTQRAENISAQKNPVLAPELLEAMGIAPQEVGIAAKAGD